MIYTTFDVILTYINFILINLKEFIFKFTAKNSNKLKTLHKQACPVKMNGSNQTLESRGKIIR